MPIAVERLEQKPFRSLGRMRRNDVFSLMSDLRSVSSASQQMQVAVGTVHGKSALFTHAQFISDVARGLISTELRT
jgi:hypothetical protein